MTRPAAIFLGIWRRGNGLARAEEGSGEESARASAFFFEKIGGYGVGVGSVACVAYLPSINSFLRVGWIVFER